MTNGRSKTAIIAVALLTAIGVIASVLIFINSKDADTERIAIFTATLFGFLTPTIGVLLLIAQGKENAEKIDHVENKVDNVSSKQDSVKVALESDPTALEATAKRIESKVR